MSLSYDGENIFKTSKNDLDSYEKFQNEQREQGLAILNGIETKNRMKALVKWKQWCPKVYKNASIKAIRGFDPESADNITEAVKESKASGIPQSLIIRSADNTKGKTWAMYAYITNLIGAYIIDEPDSQVKIISEAELFSNLTDFVEKRSTMRSLFGPKVKVIGIDNVGRHEKDADKVWPIIEDKARNTNIGFVLCMTTKPNTPGDRNFYKHIQGIAENATFVSLKGRR
jgi:hypothetical protein